MSRGGKRDGAGRPSVWNHKETKLVRIPVAIVDQVLEIAYKLDRGESLDSVSKSKSAAVSTRRIDQMSLLDVSPTPAPLTFTQLAARLGCSTGTLHRHKKRGNHDLTSWSREKDPDSWGWEFREEVDRYYPV